MIQEVHDFDFTKSEGLQDAALSFHAAHKAPPGAGLTFDVYPHSAVLNRDGVPHRFNGLTLSDVGELEEIMISEVGRDEKHSHLYLARVRRFADGVSVQ